MNRLGSSPGEGCCVVFSGRTGVTVQHISVYARGKNFQSTLTELPSGCPTMNVYHIQGEYRNSQGFWVQLRHSGVIRLIQRLLTGLGCDISVTVERIGLWAFNKELPRKERNPTMSGKVKDLNSRPPDFQRSAFNHSITLKKLAVF